MFEVTHGSLTARIYVVAMKTTLLCSLIVLLMACGDDDTTIDGGADAATDAMGGDATDPNEPILAIAECGSVPLASTEPGRDESAPAAFEVGERVGGQVDPDSADDDLHFWSVDVTPGLYHLVVDSDRVAGDDDGIGVNVRDVLGGGASPLLRISAIEPFVRGAAFVEVEAVGEMVLSVEPNWEAENYSMMLIRNGDPVPAPRFDDCPTLRTIAIGDNQTLSFTDSGTEGSRMWFAVDLPAGDYRVTTDITLDSGMSDNITFVLSTYKEFGQDREVDEVIMANEIGVTFSASGEFSSSGAPMWFHLENDDSAATVELALEAL